MTNRTLQLNIEKSLQDKSAMSAQDLIATTANVIGAAYKGTAFVPKKIVSSNTSLFFDAEGDEEFTYNTRASMLGTSRQNRHEHLYDDYSCNVDSNGYDAISIWMDNGGTQSTFTRVLGIGTGIRDADTGKMQNSGFNASNNISSGTLTQTISRNLNAIDTGIKGNVSFLFKTVNEISKRSNVVDSKSDTLTADYLDEIFCNENKDTTEVNILSDVMIFASGVLPSLSSEENIDSFDYFKYDTQASSYNSQTFQTTNEKQNFINLNGFSPYIKTETYKPFKFFQNKYLDTSNYIKKQSIYSSSDKNYFCSRFLEKGYFTYATFPLCGINDYLTPHKRFTLLTAKPYNDVGDQSVPDYNSFESEFTTAKTPWITSQPLFRTSFGDTTSDNRKNIHESVQDLFRFWSLSDGDVGNKFRIKINPTKRGEPNIETNYMRDDEFSSFDIYIFIYEARVNRYVNIETFKNVNLHPNSPNYISNLIGDVYEYYDFDLKKVVQKGFFKNKSQFLRVEVNDIIEDKTLKIQHTLMPSGFRSYPHIKIEKNAFSNFVSDEDTLNTLFNQGVYQLPPTYVLNKYSEYDKTHLISHINNHWGVVFNRSKIKNNVLQSNDLREYNNPIEENISPHFYYTKYFLNGTKNNKDIWLEQDNYLNSFFHLEKILVKTDSEGVQSLDRFKHSGRTPNNTSNYKYLNLSDDTLWLSNRKLKNTYRDKLSFDFFTYGGFDGTDIRDQDKKNFRNDAIIRELTDSNEKKTTFTAYDIAIDTATSDTTCAGDILIVPGIKEIPVIKKCTQICEEDRKHFYLADIGGAASSSNIKYFYDERNGGNTPVASSKGIMGQYYKIENDLSRYFLNKSSIKVNDKELILKQENNPDIGDSFIYFNYKSVLEHFYETIYDLWDSECISSRYLFATYGDLIVNFQGTSERQMTSDLFSLAKIAQNVNPNASITNRGGRLIYHGTTAKTNLILQHLLNFNNESFEDKLVKARKSNINVMFTPKSQNARLLTELTSYENRKHVFKEQRYIRVIQEVKKIIKYNVFLDESFIHGGLFFSQNSISNNIYQKFEIQINLLMQSLVDSGYISNFLVKIQKSQDPRTILDMQNYIIRGNIVLQFDNEDIINLEIDDVLSDLSLLANPGQDAVYIPR